MQQTGSRLLSINGRWTPESHWPNHFTAICAGPDAPKNEDSLIPLSQIHINAIHWQNGNQTPTVIYPICKLNDCSFQTVKPYALRSSLKIRDYYKSRQYQSLVLHTNVLEFPTVSIICFLVNILQLFIERR